MTTLHDGHRARYACLHCGSRMRYIDGDDLKCLACGRVMGPAPTWARRAPKPAYSRYSQDELRAAMEGKTA